MNNTSIINPYDQSIIGEIALDSEALAMQKLSEAHRLFLKSKNWLTKPQRRDILEKFKSNLEKNRDQIIAVAISEGGKPYKDTVIEFERGLSGIDIAIWELFNHHGEVVPMELNDASMNRHAYTIKEPRGVVLAISAFNHPFNLIIHQVVPAIAASCPVLMKPALKTPLTCKLIIDALYDTGLDPTWCQYLPIENDICEKIVSNDKMAFMSFIGSARVGWYLRGKLAAGAHCSLEHGGIAPVIIDDDVALEEVAPKLVKSSFYHAGQVCVSTQRIYVAEHCVDAFLESFRQQSSKLLVGNPREAETDVGPLISPSELLRVEKWVNESVNNGGKLVLGGKRVLKSCFEPTIIFNPRRDDQLSTEEIFGPVVAVYSYKTIEDAIERANETKYFFQASMFTQNIDRAFMAARTLFGKCILINDHSAFRVDWMPFGGHRLSGLGVSGIGYTMKELSVDKLLVFNFKS